METLDSYGIRSLLTVIQLEYLSNFFKAHINWLFI